MQPDITQRDTDGKVMICTGCGSTETLAAICARNPKVVSCCPDRKMVRAGDEMARLYAEVQRLRGYQQVILAKHGITCVEHHEACKKLKKAAEALEYYAAGDHYDGGDVPGHIYVLDDHGHIARETLEELQK